MFAYELGGELAARDVDVLFVGLNGVIHHELAPEGARVADIVPGEPKRLSLTLARALADYFRAEKPDVVQANGGYSLKYAILANKILRGGPPVVYRNIGFASDWVKSDIQKAWTGWLIRSADAIAAVSAASKADLVLTFGISENRIEVIHRGVPMAKEDRDAARRTLQGACGIPDGAPVVIHVGSFTPEKNHIGLVRIFERVQRQLPEAHLVLVGGGETKAMVEAQAQGIESIHLLGVRSDVPTLMAGADLFVLPSLTEGLPGVILEAGAQELPSVAYDVGGVAESVADGETGALVAEGDEAGFADAVVRLLRDNEGRYAAGLRARSLVEAGFTPDRSTDDFVDLYERVIASRT